jgi:CDP-glycerol glycerophosphotransferase (TagB/SpsB family)
MKLLFLSDVTKATFAYIDPGSGSVLISLIVAALAIAFYYLRSFFYEKARYLFKRQNPAHIEQYKLVFYSEGKQYWHVFLPIIRELDRRKVPFTYFCSDRDDPGLTADFAYMNSIYIGEGHEAYFVLNRLKADLVVMTTPGLDVLQIKRSKTVKHYCFLQHSFEDDSTGRPYSFDYFDSMLEAGKHQLEIVRQIEKIRGLPAKAIEVIGCTYLDIMQEELAKNNFDNLRLETNKKTILLAPSWGDKGFLSKYGDILINKLLDSNYQIILRPHPQSWKSESVLLEMLKTNTTGANEIIWDDNPSGLEAMKYSDVMISDLSGIIFDYIFLFARPVIIAEFEIDPRKYDMNILPSKSSTLMRLIREGKIGYRLKESEIDNIVNIIEEAINYNYYAKFIPELKEHIYFYPGEAGKRGADFVQAVLDSLANDR